MAAATAAGVGMGVAGIMPAATVMAMVVDILAAGTAAAAGRWRDRVSAAIVLSRFTTSDPAR